MAKGGYAPMDGLKLCYEVHEEGTDFLPEEVTAAISDLLSTRSQP